LEGRRRGRPASTVQKITVTFTLPVETERRLRDYAHETQEFKGQVIAEALEKFLTAAKR
jgi:predicted DNA-binding protein